MLYEDFRVYDFINDPFFRKWVLDPDTETSDFWESWQQTHPDSRSIIREARTLVWLTHFDDIEIKGAAQTKEKIKAQLFSKQLAPVSEKNIRQERPKRYYLIAAVVTFLLLLSVYLTLPLWNQPQQYTTAYGERMEVILPDGSKAILNANSNLIIGTSWETTREVWLKGEAFFDIEECDTTEKENLPKKGKRGFTVHAGEVDIQVLGTRFNVQQRCHSTQVILEEGMVTLKEKQQTRPPLRMNAGEAISYSDKAQVFKKEMVNAKTALSWKDGKHIFDATPLHTIAELLAQTYGYEVEITDKALKQKRFSAQVPYGEVDLLIMLLKESLEVDIVQQSNAIVIK